MTIRPEVIAFVRTLIRGQNDENDRIEAKLDEVGWDGYASYLSAVFFYAIDKKFGGKRDDKEIVRFVAEMRTDSTGAGSDIGAAEAERVIMSVLDSSVPLEGVSAEALGRIQTLATYKALSEAQLLDDDLESILTRAAELANAQSA